MSKILKTPDICSLSKNSMLFEVQAEQFFQTVEVFPKVRISFTSEPSVGRYFTFSFLNPETLENETIYFKTYLYVENEGEIIGNSGATLAGATDNWIKGLSTIKLLNSFYTINRVDDGIIDIIAKQANDDLIPKNIDENITGNFGFAYEVDNFSIQATEREGYELKALVFYNDPKTNALSGINQSNSWELIATEYLAPNSNGIAYFDVCEIIDSKIESDMDETPIPPYQNDKNLNDSLYYYAPNLKQYFVVFVETWLNNIDELKASSDKLFVHHGGISVDDEISNNPINQLLQRSAFLTWNFGAKTIDVNQIDWCWWMNNSISKQIRVTLKIQTDVQQHEFIVIEKEISAFQTIGLKAMINEYINNLSTIDLISIPTDENIVWYEFSISEFYDGSFGDSVANFTYYLVKECNKHYIIYINPFGVPESFATKSDWEERTEISKEIASRGLNYNNSHLRRKAFSFNATHQNAYNVSSELMKREFTKRLQSILNSTECFVFENGKYIPVLIENASIPVWNNSILLSSLEFELLKSNLNEKPSFFEHTPKIEVKSDGYGWRFDLNLNGFDFDTAEDLIVKDWNGDQIKTIVFDNNSFSWLNECDPSNWNTESLPEGIILFETSITDKKGNSISLKGIYEIKYQKSSIYWDGGILAANTLTFGSYSVVYSNVILLYNIQQTQPIFTAFDINPTVNIVATYTTPGRKNFTIKSTSFQDIEFFESIGNDIKRIMLTDFYNLVNLNIQNTLIEGTLFLNKNQKLQNINIVDSTLSKIEFGFMPNLDILALDTLPNLTELELEACIKQLWIYRKAYLNHVDIYLLNLVTPTDETLDIINGTGEYSGDGLVQNDITVFIV